MRVVQDKPIFTLLSYAVSNLKSFFFLAQVSTDSLNICSLTGG